MGRSEALERTAVDEARADILLWKYHPDYEQPDQLDYLVDVLVAAVREEAAAGRLPSIEEAMIPDSDLTCEAHPWLFWPHDDCGGPGMPIQASLNRLSAVEDELAISERENAALRNEKALWEGRAKETMQDHVDNCPLEAENAALRSALEGARDALVRIEGLSITYGGAEEAFPSIVLNDRNIARAALARVVEVLGE